MNDILRNDIRHHCVAHAYLLCGGEEEGAAEASAFAAAVNCLAPVDGEACGSCRHCLQLKAGQFPDFAVLKPEKKNYSVDEMRKLLKIAALTAKNEVTRIFWLQKADYLSEEAADFLLKTLEEPAADNIFLLTAENNDRILETVISRCRVVRISGEPRRLTEEDTAAVFTLLSTVKREAMEYLFHSAEKYAESKETAAALFEAAAALLAANYEYRRGGKAPQHCFTADWSEELLFALWQWAVSAQVLLSGSINTKLIVENFLLTIKRNGGSYGNCSWCTL